MQTKECKWIPIRWTPASTNSNSCRKRIVHSPPPSISAAEFSLWTPSRHVTMGEGIKKNMSPINVNVPDSVFNACVSLPCVTPLFPRPKKEIRTELPFLLFLED